MCVNISTRDFPTHEGNSSKVRCNSWHCSSVELFINRKYSDMDATLESPPPTLSSLPIELLDNILRQLNLFCEGHDALGKALRLNKRISSVAVEHLYKNPVSYSNDVMAPQLFNTLLFSANGATHYPYHCYIEELSFWEWHRLFPESKIDPGKLRDLLGKLLECKKLRTLSLELPADLSFLATLPNCDLTALKNLDLTVKRSPVDAKALTWMKAMTSRMHLKSLTIRMFSPCSLEFINLPRNTLSSISVSRFRKNCQSLSGSIQSLLSSHSQSLESISVSYSDFAFGSLLSVQSLQEIHVHDSPLKGWDNLFRSLKCLKSLSFDDVIISGAIPFVSVPTQLETLILDIHCESAGLVAAWLDGNCRSFTSLRALHVRRLPAKTLAKILDNCPTLVELTYLQAEYRPDEFFPPGDDHLQAVSRLAPASLQSLSLFYGSFTSHGFSVFIAEFPPSITRLDIFGSRGLDPSNFRLLLQLPSLRYLDVSDISVEKKDIREMEEIAKSVTSPGFQVFWDFTPLCDE